MTDMEAEEPGRMTFADYREWTTEERWEIIDGVPYLMTGPSVLHQAIAMELSVELHTFLRGRNCRVLAAPLDVKLSDYDVVQPDLLVVCGRDQLQRGHIDGPPDLAVEILSPSTMRHDRVRKFNLYAGQGVSEYWLVNPHPFIVEVLENREGLFTTIGVYTDKDVLRSARFPGLEIDLKALFATLPEQPPIDEVREGRPPYAGANV